MSMHNKVPHPHTIAIAAAATHCHIPKTLPLRCKCYTGHCPTDRVQQVIMVRHLFLTVPEGLHHTGLCQEEEAALVVATGKEEELRSWKRRGRQGEN